MPGTQTEAALPLFGGTPTTDKSAVTCTTKATWYMVGLADAGYGSTNTYVKTSSLVGATSLVVNAATNHVQGELISIDAGTSAAELAFVTAISGTTFTVQSILGGGLLNAHTGGSTHHVRALVCGLQPQFSGRYLIIATGSLTSNNTGDTVEAQLTYGSLVSADAPANAAAATGTLIGNVGTVVALTGVLTQPFVCIAVIGTPGASGTLPVNAAALTVGTPYWLDLSVQDVTTGAKTVQAQFVSMWAVEE
jgi:hypothetical protein